MMIGILLAAALSLDGSWAFRFEEGKTLETASGRTFEATDSMSVPGCYDMMPKWLCKRGTGLYRRTFVLERPVENAWLLVEGMGLRAKFAVDGREIGSSVYPWQELEIPTGPLAAGEHEIFAALDNTLDPAKQKLALDYYDFYLYGGFYHGVSLVFDNRKLRVRTRDYKTGRVEIEAVNFKAADFEATLVFDGKHEVKATFKGGRTTVNVPDFKLWSPESPAMHTVEARVRRGEGAPETGAVRARFGIREVKAEKRRIWLNGEPIYLKGANRHEAHPAFGAATPEAQMVEDLQLMKSINCNFVRGCHYQQSRRFLDYCDEMGMLVWEESLGWNNSAKQMADPEYFRQQVDQTKAMVKASFNHPSVIIYAFQNENASQTKEGKKMNDALIDAIKDEDSGRLVTFACSHCKDDISNEKTDLVAYNTYPGWFDNKGVGDNANLNRIVDEKVREITGRFRKLYPEKPIIVSEMGVCGVYGAHDPAAAQWTEEFQCDYVGAAIRAVFANPEMCGFTIWHFADARSYHRSGGALRGKPFAQNLAGVYDGYRRAKKLAETVREHFAQKAVTEGGK